MESIITLTLHPSVYQHNDAIRAFDFSSHVVIDNSVRGYMALNSVPAIAIHPYEITFATCLLIC